MAVIPDAIYRQLGGQRFAAMTGAQFLAPNKLTLGITLPNARTARGIKAICITLDADDTYTVQFYRPIRRGAFDPTVAKELTGIYADQLQAVFTENTGLETHL